MKKITFATALIASLILLVVPAWAASTIKVTIPTFTVELNGQIVDNQFAQYPLIVYKDITYFPMTWRFAVDEFGWSYSFDHNTLKINTTDVFRPVIDDSYLNLRNHTGATYYHVTESAYVGYPPQHLGNELSAGDQDKGAV